MATVTIVLAALNAVVVHVWWVPDRSGALTFAVIDGPMLFVALAGLLAITIAETGRYEFKIVLVVMTVLAVAWAFFAFWGDPLAYVVALSLLITTVVSGIAMNRAWRTDQNHA